MQLTTIEMPTQEAKRRLEEYRIRLAGERTAQDERIARGYRAMARGLPLLKLTESVQAGGFFDNGLPRIAIVRADATECWVRWDTWPRGYVYSSDDESRNMSALVNDSTVRVNIASPEPQLGRRQWRGRTIVPLIPPRHRPNMRRLHYFHILWEVEQWGPVPPKDPALLRWIGGDLWAVQAVWDLTELERAVLTR